MMRKAELRRFHTSEDKPKISNIGGVYRFGSEDNDEFEVENVEGNERAAVIMEKGGERKGGEKS